jgi:ribosomal protein L11 methyltransferase
VIRLAVRVRREDAELVLAELLELAPSGVEEVALGEDVVEYAVFGAPGELPALPDLRAAAGQALVELSTTEIADDWADRWR